MSRCRGCEPAALAAGSFPGCPPGACLLWGCCGLAGAGLPAGEDDVAGAPLEGAQGRFWCLAFGQLLLVAGAAGAGRWLTWVTAARWVAWLGRRFPRRDSRPVFGGPQDAWTGAVPLGAAK